MSIIELYLNSYDDNNQVVCTDKVSMSTHQISDVIDHAAHLILTIDTIDDYDSDDFEQCLSELREALEASGALQTTRYTGA